MRDTGGEHDNTTALQDMSLESSATPIATPGVKSGGILQAASDQQPNGAFLDDGVPFAAHPAIAARQVLPPSAIDTVIELTHRWRVPLSLLFGVVLSGSVYLAYQPPDAEGTALQEALIASPSTSSVEEPAFGSEAGQQAVTGPTSAPATEADPDSSSMSDSATATSGENASTTAPTTPPTSAQSTTTSTTQATTTTTQTTTTTVAPKPASVSGTVSFDSSDGQKVKSLEVRLIPDSDNPQVEAFTTIDGTYRLEADPACYLVRFMVPDGQDIVAGQHSTPVCFEPGQALTIDLTIDLPKVRAPKSCEILIGDDRGAGVEVHDRKGPLADSYAFYGESGQFVLSTYGLGPPDDLDAGEQSVKWTSDGNGFEESDVYSVAAEHPQGVTSKLVQCSRRQR